MLNDISLKESQYYSQRDENQERSMKKFKNDTNGIEETTLRSNDIERNTNFRTNSILDRLKQRKNLIPDSNNVPDNKELTSNTRSENVTQELNTNLKDNQSRKNLILEIFRRNNVESSSAGPCSSEAKSVSNKRNEVSLDNQRNERFKTLEKSVSKSVKPVYKPVTLVRQFPGPAGLLPAADLSSESISHVVTELSRLDDSEDCTDGKTVNDSSIMSNYYSQNTTSLFNDGPWQSLINDLSYGFLNGHEISVIKQKVLTNSYRNNKVPFLAGIVQKVDFSRANPEVVLKDCTGTIEGTICKEILVKYPYSLDIGAVLFLGNVGLLTVGSYLKKFHVIVTMKNIVNVYTVKTKIFNSSEMNARLENLRNDSNVRESFSNRVSDSNSLSLNSELNFRPNVENLRVNESKNSGFNCRNSKNGSKSLDGNSNHTSKNINDGVKQPIVLNKIATVISNKKTQDPLINKQGEEKSFEKKQVVKKNTNSTFETENFEDFDDDFTASFLDIDDDMISKTVTNSVSVSDKELTNNSTELSKENTVPNSVNLNLKIGLNPGKNDVKISEIVEQKSTASFSTANQNEKSSPKKMSNVKLKLSVFRSNSELTPPECGNREPALSENDTANSRDFRNENKDQVQSNSISDLLLNKENDSDEEIFSQLDIESIVSNYNSSNDVN